jgi:hypothetical protein
VGCWGFGYRVHTSSIGFSLNPRSPLNPPILGDFESGSPPKYSLRHSRKGGSACGKQERPQQPKKENKGHYSTHRPTLTPRQCEARPNNPQTNPCGGGVGDVLRPLLGVWGKPPRLLAVPPKKPHPTHTTPKANSAPKYSTPPPHAA